MATGDGDGAAFLQALARRMNTRLMVFVPVSREPRAIWISVRGDDDEVDQLAAVGRDWLTAHDHVDPGRSGADTASSVEDDTVILAPIWASDGASGVLVARKDQGGVWSCPERDVILFAADYCSPLLEHWASRPRPDHSMLPTDDTGPSLAGSLETGIRTAAANGEFFLRYQPEIDLRDGRVVALEALVRWRHPLRGELGPESFIAVAERSDLIRVLGSWVVDESLRQFAQLLSVRPGLSLRVNVSPLQIDGDLVAQFADALIAHGVSGEQVCVEITENVLSGNTSYMAATLAALKRLGISSAIDDLASGYSSLTRLRSLPVDLVKIDRGLISGLDGDARAQAIVSALLALADDLGIRVVAEGVETAAEAAVLRNLGCRRAQGHYFGRPMTTTEIAEFLSSANRPRP